MELNAKNIEGLIISLIKDNVRNTQLILGLNKLGLEAGLYSLNIAESIFQLIGFEQDDFEDDVFENYLEYIEEVVSVDIVQDFEELNAISKKIYDDLIIKKQLQLKNKSNEGTE